MAFESGRPALQEADDVQRAQESVFQRASGDLVEYGTGTEVASYGMQQARCESGQGNLAFL